MTRVAITGVGVISAIGKSVPEFWDSLQHGRSGIRPIQAPGCNTLRFPNGAEVQDYNSSDYIDEKQAQVMDRFAEFAVIAAREAVRDSALDFTPEMKAGGAVITGACVGGQSSEDKEFEGLYRRDRNRCHPLTIPRIMANAGASLISMEMGLTGPGFTLSTACASAAHAIGLAYWLVRSGAVPIAVTGGSEAPFSLGLLRAWEAMRVVSPTTCRPFCRDRNGMILGEGGAMLVLEPLEAAQARGAKIYSELCGFGMSSDASHITHPSTEGPALAMKRALADGEIDPLQVGYINAHGTGTDVNDPTEAAAIRQVFGAHTDQIAVSSTKSMHGHGLGVAAAMEAVATVLGMHHQLLPPTANFTELDPAIQLDVIANEARPAEVECSLSNSFAFGGLNASLAFRRV
ncbi:MAG TPA: beta-ketoacyl-[acyl-carrier-protein] synthase family protein [Candidatus Angelobacter sp.]|nr:beta-ketoacyl-[acyl-carrier-protein] synthase family protein [Candidatus Angelobacter sp.]